MPFETQLTHRYERQPTTCGNWVSTTLSTRSTFAQRTYREIMYLSSDLRSHPNIVKLVNIIRAANDVDIYLVFEHLGAFQRAGLSTQEPGKLPWVCAETDLHAVIRAKILQPIHKQFVTYQLVKALYFMHSAELLHRDVKPSNLLLNADCSVKLCDFGLCRSALDESVSSGSILTDYVATRWYRAPEILLGSTAYGKAVDMWSVGCILGEMLTGRAIFPGNSTMNQLDRILQLTGQPTEEDLREIGCVPSPQLAPTTRCTCRIPCTGRHLQPP